ncbi:MAG: hypothetical protein U0P45_09480 [Acidimicrobiales bacterium]
MTDPTDPDALAAAGDLDTPTEDLTESQLEARRNIIAQRIAAASKVDDADLSPRRRRLQKQLADHPAARGPVGRHRRPRRRDRRRPRRRWRRRQLLEGFRQGSLYGFSEMANGQARGTRSTTTAR